jgi:putative addiction module component (TIGR02574 family)
MGKPAWNIAELTPEERLRLIDELWESLGERREELPLTDKQREELDRRLDDLEAHGAEGIPWEDVLHRVRNRGK